MATALSIYRGALREAGLDGSLDFAQARAILDDTTYNSTLLYCIEQGPWNFAMRDASISSSATPTTGFGYSFAKPADWVRTGDFGMTGTFQWPYDDWVDQGSVWLANVNPIYVKYVSNGASYGLNLAIWPESFARFVELELASRIAGKNPNFSANARLLLEKKLRDAKTSALSKDALNEASPRRVPSGRLVQSRFGQSSTRIDPLIP